MNEPMIGWETESEGTLLGVKIDGLHLIKESKFDALAIRQTIVHTCGSAWNSTT
jgi:hypothetical protein